MMTVTVVGILANNVNMISLSSTSRYKLVHLARISAGRGMCQRQSAPDYHMAYNIIIDYLTLKSTDLFSTISSPPLCIKCHAQHKNNIDSFYLVLRRSDAAATFLSSRLRRKGYVDFFSSVINRHLHSPGFGPFATNNFLFHRLPMFNILGAWIALWNEASWTTEF